MEYAIIEAGSRLSLIERVENEVRDGWKPIGGVCLGPAGEFYQAMTRGQWVKKSLTNIEA